MACAPDVLFPIVFVGDTKVLNEHDTNALVQVTYSELMNIVDCLEKALKSRCPHSKIWLCKIPRRSPLSWLHSEIANVNTFLEKSFHGKNVKFINSCPEFGPRYFMEDMVHFNYNGVQLYGDKIACSIINFHINQANHYR